MPQTEICGIFIMDFVNRKGSLWHYHQLSQKKGQSYEQSAELSIFVKLQWKL